MGTDNQVQKEKKHPLWGWIISIVGGLLTFIGLVLLLIFSTTADSDISQYIFCVLLLGVGALLLFIGIRLITHKDKRTTRIISIGGSIAVLVLAGILCVSIVNYTPASDSTNDLVINPPSPKQSTYTPLPTYTSYPTYTLIPSLTKLTGPTKTTFPTNTAGPTNTLLPTTSPTGTFTNTPISTHTHTPARTDTPVFISTLTPVPTLLNSLGEFEASEFCIVYDCIASESWELKSGGIDHTYDINTVPTVLVEVTTINTIPVDYGLMFFDRDTLDTNDYQQIFLFLKSVQPGAIIDNTIEQYIQKNVKMDLFQICEASPIEFGLLKIWVGKIFEQTIKVSTDCSS
jgi:hypothetical protein